jgi:sulfide:quinone oxidoreductase
MEMTPDAERRRVLVAGGGVAGLEAVLALHEIAKERVAIHLLAPEATFNYRPRAVLEPFGLGEQARYPLGKIAELASLTHYRDALASVDTDARCVTTEGGQELGYDSLVVAVGASAATAFHEAVTFSADRPEVFATVLEAIRAGRARRIAFIVPSGVAWPLPLYELALMTAIEVRRPDNRGLQLTVITPEPAPLAIFGSRASEAVTSLLAERSIDVLSATYVERIANGEAVLRPGGERLPFDGFVSLPRLVGPSIAGIPHDETGFIPVDKHARVIGVDDVFAAGDATTLPVKQGGLGAQQADAAAETIAAAAGLAIEPQEFRPVLRGVLLTHGDPEYLRAAISGGQGETSMASGHVLWWPSAKIAGRFLAPLLRRLDIATHGALDPQIPGVTDVDVELHDVEPL